MYILYLSKLRTEFYTQSNRGRRWQLIEPFDFSVDGKVFTVPNGFWTDFASVPRPIWPIISPYDLGVGPIPHDFGYFTGYGSREYWDKVFEACMIKDEIDKWKRVSAYQAVSLFSGMTWSRYRRENLNRQLFQIVSTGKLQIIHWDHRPRMGTAARELLSTKEVLWRGTIEQLTA